MLDYALTFAAPWAFLGLLAWLFLPRRRGWLGRFVASLLLLTALAQPSLTRPGQNVAVLVDVSEGVGNNALEAARAFDFSELGRGSKALVFAGGTHVVENFEEVSRDALRPLRLDATDIARALQVARAEGVERILLIASGIQSRGDALAALPGMPVDIHRVNPVANARLVSLLAPDEVGPGEMVEVIAVIESDLETELVLRPRVGEEELEPIRTRIESGRTPISFSFPVEESVDVSAAIEVDYPQPTADDAQQVHIAVSEGRPVLVINDPAMARLLEAQGFETALGTAEDITTPFGYEAVIIRENAGEFSAGQLSFLEDFVRDGGGLMMTGGEMSFGLGGWYRTPIEEVLPVDTALRAEIEIPQVAIVLVIDRSGSMRAENPSRISLARQGAIELVELAHTEDLIGLIVFDHNYEWIFRPRQATERGKREMIEAIARVTPQGGTIIGPAYEEALEALRQTEASIKHIIILSDGEFFDGTGMQGPTSMGPKPDFEAMAASGLDDGITTTTIGIGEADYATIERIARAGGGRFYGVTDTASLPQIFTSEAITTTRSVVREVRFSPTLHEHPFTVGLGTPPEIQAYVASTLKEDSEVLLEGLDGEPVLAVSRRGLGRTAALTTDLNAWAGDFAAWPELPGLLGTIVRWLQARPEPFSASVSAEGNRLRIVVDAVQEGHYLNNERLEARYGGTRTTLRQTAPGRYEGTLEAPAEGGSVLVLRGNEIVARSAVTLPHPAFAREGADALLYEIARRSGGEIVEAPGPYAPPPTGEAVALWPYLAAAGLMLFLLELVYRRFEGFRLRSPEAIQAEAR